MFGCHNCPYMPLQDENFENSPCATCKAAQDPVPHSQYEDDPANFSSNCVMHPAYEEDWEQDPFIQFKNELFSALAQSIHLLASMQIKYPETYKFVEAKMRDPNISYSELALKFSCRKQNVMYHLRKAVSLCPPLAAALIIDTRFSRGQQAFPHRMKQEGIAVLVSEKIPL